jgi:hypothetical protein
VVRVVSATAEIKAFFGIDQSGGAHNTNMNYAYDAANCLTDRGILAPAPGYVQVYPSLPEPIVTLCSFYRRNHLVESERSVLVAATAHDLYVILEGGSAWSHIATGLQSGEWSYVTYESVRNNGTPEDTSDDYNTDILIMSNAKDGVLVVYGDTLAAELKTDLHKFAIIERHAERIWGTGVDGEPDNIYYSQPLNPFKWGYEYDGDGGILPEQSGGVIQMPTWDGDKFVALKRFSNNLLAFKQRSAWYVRGVTAGDFAMVEAYGSDGVFAPSTIVADGAAAYYLAVGGLGSYDGDTAQLVDNDRLVEIFRKVGACAPETACAMVLRHVLYLSLPIYTGATYTTTVNGVSVTKLVEPTRNNTIIVYDIRRKTYMIRTGIQADALHNHSGRILFTSGDDPYNVYEITGYNYCGEEIPVKWESSWQDLGAKNSIKSSFEVYITGFDIQPGHEQEITLKIITEKKTKSKTITLNSDFKKTRFLLNASGVRFKFAIEAQSNSNWCISGGVQIKLESDEA